MAKKPFLPAADAAYRLWLMNYLGYATANSVALGLSSTQVTQLDQLASAFFDAQDVHTAAQANAEAKRQEKLAKRSASEMLVRQLTRIIQANPAVTDAQREALKITVPSTERTPAPVPTSVPLAEIEKIDALQHTIEFRDGAGAGRGKPDGVHGAELYMKVVAAGQAGPSDPSEMELVDVVTASKTVRAFNGTDFGKVAWYRPRWVSTRGDKGPFGPLVAATIAA
jgi:hypothetical protein